MKLIFVIIALNLISGLAFSQNKSDENINVTTFALSEIPDSLSGCSCLFSNSKEEYDSDKFIYFDDIGDNCLISINNKILFLSQESDEYSNDYYTAYIQNKIQVDEGYESAVYKAELVIVDKKGNKKILKVYGLCGC